MTVAPAEPKTTTAMTPTVAENIREVIGLEEEGLRGRTKKDRVADGIANFVGTLTFVLIHLVWFSAWALYNAGVIPHAKLFDPYPYQLLAMLVSLEGVLLSTFVLIKQNRMAQSADRRAHLDLQINLLTEKEVTKLLQLMERLSVHMGTGSEIDEETRELGEETAVGDLARELQEQLPDE